jgi:hypothetical protein
MWYKFWMLVCYILEIFPVEVRVFKFFWNKFQTGQLDTFVITYFLGCFKHWDFVETEERYLCTCGKNIICIFIILYVGIYLFCARVLRPKVQFTYDQQTHQTPTLSTSPTSTHEVSPMVSIGTARTKFMR